MIYSSWDIECDRLKLAILSLFCPFTPLKTKKKKKFFWKNDKNIIGDIILHICTKNPNHMMYGSWDMEYDGHNFLSFWTIFCPFTTLTTQKIKNFEKIKKHLGYLFTHVHHKLWSHDVWFLKYGAWQTDGQMDGQKKWHIGVLAPPKKSEDSLFVLIKTL